MTWTESFETIAGCRTRIMRGGNGAPLLFLHGSGGASMWLPFMDKLAERFDLIVPEHPGFGGSDSPAWLDNIGDLAYFYLDFIRHLGLDRLHLVGTSIGGWIAAEVAVRDCSALATLTLVAPAGLRVKGVRRADIFMMSAEEATRHLFHDQAFIERALARKPTEAEIETTLKNQLTTAKLGWEPRMFNPNLHKWLHRITVPTQVIWGENDRILPAAYGPAFTDLIPGSRLEIIEACGHLPQVEKPDVLVSKVAEFASRVPA